MTRDVTHKNELGSFQRKEFFSQKLHQFDVITGSGATPHIT